MKSDIFQYFLGPISYGYLIAILDPVSIVFLFTCNLLNKNKQIEKNRK